MNCSRAQALISLVLDGEATENQKRILDFHLLGCPACRRAMRMTSDISRIASDLPFPVPPVELEQKVRKLLASNSASRRFSGRYRGALLAVPAAAALLMALLMVLPPSSPVDPGSEMQLTAGTEYSSKNTETDISLKSGSVRAIPLSEYSRQASLISF